MPSASLDNLARIGQLKPEPPDRAEFDGLVASARVRLVDAEDQRLALESRFDLAYNAAHALAHAALRWNGYRATNRYLVFQCLPHTLGMEAGVWQVLALCHERRNRAEYEGIINLDDRLLADLLAATRLVLDALDRLVDVE